MEDSSSDEFAIITENPDIDKLESDCENPKIIDDYGGSDDENIHSATESDVEEVIDKLNVFEEIVFENKSAEECKFAVVYCQQNMKDVMAAVILRETVGCKIYSFAADVVPGVSELPESNEEIIILGTFWNNRLAILQRNYFPTKSFTLVVSRECPEVAAIPKLTIVCVPDSLAWIKNEFDIDAPEYLAGIWSNDMISGLEFSCIDDSLEEKCRKLYLEREFYETVSKTGELLRDFRISIARKRTGDHGGIITAANGNRFAICNATEFHDEMHTELSRRFPDVNGTITFIKNFRRDTTMYDMRSEKISVMDQLSAFSPHGNKNSARIEIFGTHRFPPF